MENKSGTKWTEDEILKLKELVKGNTPTGIISLKMGRTKNAIQAKAHNENISLKPTNKSPYDRRVSTSKKKGTK